RASGSMCGVRRAEKAGNKAPGPPVARAPPSIGSLPMQHKLLHESNGQRTYVVVLETGEEVLSSLKAFAGPHNIHTAQLTAIGAFSDVVLQYFDWDKKAYQDVPV